MGISFRKVPVDAHPFIPQIFICTPTPFQASRSPGWPAWQCLSLWPIRGHSFLLSGCSHNSVVRTRCQTNAGSVLMNANWPESQTWCRQATRHHNLGSKRAQPAGCPIAVEAQT